jgi:hypothetical protein
MALRGSCSFCAGLAVLSACSLSPSVLADIIVGHDVNTLSSSVAGPQEVAFAINLAEQLTHPPGENRILLLQAAPGGSRNFSPLVVNALIQAGYDVTVSSDYATPLDSFNALFVAQSYPGGDVPDLDELVEFVSSGRGVYVAGGVGPSASGEAANWNGFLTSFGVKFGSSYNNLFSVAISGADPVFQGVSQLGCGIGSRVELSDASGDATIIQSAGSQGGVYARAKVCPPQNLPQGVIAISGPAWLESWSTCQSLALHSCEGEGVRIFEEQLAYVLSGPLSIDISTVGSFTTYKDLTPGEVGSGVTINSHILHVDPPGNSLLEVEASVSFDSDILGLIVLSSSLESTNSIVGSPGVFYGRVPNRGLELGGSDPTPDGLTVSEDRRTLSIQGSTQNWMDEVRVITAGYFADCDGDGVDDTVGIACFGVPDADRNGVPDACDPIIGDISQDGLVDAADLALLLGAWGMTGGGPADLNGDKVVNGADLGILLGAWSVG